MKKGTLSTALFIVSLLCIMPQQTYSIDPATENTSNEPASFKDQVVHFGTHVYKEADTYITGFAQEHPNAVLAGGIIGAVVGGCIILRVALSKILKLVIGAAICAGGIWATKKAIETKDTNKNTHKPADTQAQR